MRKIVFVLLLFLSTLQLCGQRWLPQYAKYSYMDSVRFNSDVKFMVPLRLEQSFTLGGITVTANGLEMNTALDGILATASELNANVGITGNIQTQLNGKSATSHLHSGVYEPALGNPSVAGYILSSTVGGVRSWIAPGTGGTGMVYPGAGIAKSTGSSWDVSVTDNSGNWNTAYSWGNHASAGYYVGSSSTIRNLLSSTITGITYTGSTGVFSLAAGYVLPATIDVSNWNTAYNWGNHASAGYLTSETSHADVLVDGDFTSEGLIKRGSSSGTYSIVTDNSANWNTAYGWGNHASAGYYVGSSSTIRGLLSSSATGLTYTNTTGIFSLTAGYSIPTTSSQTNWDFAYEEAIDTVLLSDVALLKHALFNDQTGTTYTLVLADDAKILTMTNSSANTVTVPLNSSVEFPIHTQITIVQMGTGQTSIAGATSGVTINSAGSALKIRLRYSSCTLIKTATDTWLLIGDITV